MNPDILKLINEVLTPLIGSSGQLIADITSGAKSLATSKAELASVLAIASQRLDAADVGFASRDAAEEERVAKEAASKADEPTKP